MQSSWGSCRYSARYPSIACTIRSTVTKRLGHQRRTRLSSGEFEVVAARWGQRFGTATTDFDRAVVAYVRSNLAWPNRAARIEQLGATCATRKARLWWQRMAAIVLKWWRLCRPVPLRTTVAEPAASGRHAARTGRRVVGRTQRLRRRVKGGHRCAPTRARTNGSCLRP